MYAVTGITGQVGGVVAKYLLDSGQHVRAVLRDAAKGHEWTARGCEIAIAEMTDAAALTAAFSGVEGVFVLIPPIFDPTPGFAEIKAVIAALTKAIETARPPRIVCLSTIGAQATQPNLLNQLGLVEQKLGALPVPICFLRAAWFIENSAWDAPGARAGLIESFLQPLDQKFPMVATADIGRLAAELLREDWEGRKIVELEGPSRVSPNDLAAAFASILGSPVQTEVIPRDNWEGLFLAQGMRNPLPRAQMIEGFNEGWIKFEGEPRKGQTGAETVLRRILGKQRIQ
jgi:uncharacterized protein YbjT (DUF2867 family)